MKKIEPGHLTVRIDDGRGWRIDFEKLQLWKGDEFIAHISAEIKLLEMIELLAQLRMKLVAERIL